MMKILAQLTVTFLSIGFTLLGAYVIYLYSAQTNVDEKIQIEGTEICTMMTRYPIKETSYFLEHSLLDEYKKRYPKLPYLELLGKIGHDLWQGIAFDSVDAKGRLVAFTEDNAKGPFLGRIFIWLLNQYHDMMSLGSFAKSHNKHLRIIEQYVPKTRLKSFPFGPYGVERWLEPSKQILTSVDFLLRFRHMLFQDLKQYLDKGSGSHRDIDFDGWLDEITTSFRRFDTHIARIENLLRLKKSYSREDRLPERSWVVISWGLAFILGVLLPMVLMALKFDDSAPRQFNIIVLLVTFGFLLSGGFILAKDLLLSPYVEDWTGYFAPLKTGMKHFEENEWKMVEYDYFPVNHFLADENIRKEHKELAKLLEEYRLAVMESNDCSKNIAEKLSKRFAILSSEFPSDTRSIATSHIDALALLDADLRNQIFGEVKKGKKNIIFMHRYPNKRVVFFGIKAPGSVKGWEESLSKMEQKYTEFVHHEDVQACLHVRNRVRDAARKILDFLDSMTGV